MAYNRRRRPGLLAGWRAGSLGSWLVSYRRRRRRPGLLDGWLAGLHRTETHTSCFMNGNQQKPTQLISVYKGQKPTETHTSCFRNGNQQKPTQFACFACRPLLLLLARGLQSSSSSWLGGWLAGWQSPRIRGTLGSNKNLSLFNRTCIMNWCTFGGHPKWIYSLAA